MRAAPIIFKNVTVATGDGPTAGSVEVRGKVIAALDVGSRGPGHRVDGAGGMVIPGLINAHDHLDLNHFSRIKYRSRYRHAVDWIEDIEARFDSDPDLVEPRRFAVADRLLVGVVKNLLSGVTTVLHHDPPPPPVPRRLPLRVVRRFGFCHSLDRGDAAASFRRTRPDWPWIIHLAEGVDDRAAGELGRLDGLGALGPNTVLVHGVGLNSADRQRLVSRGGGLIWCPTSNDFLFGRTAEVGDLAAAGCLALGTDSRLTGELDVLAELRAAAATGQLPGEQLLPLVTTSPARLLRLTDGGRGRIRVGWQADLVLLPPARGGDPASQLLELTRADLRLVMIAGRPVVADPDLEPLFDVTRTPARRVTLDGVDKLMAGRLVEQLHSSSLGEGGLTL